MRIRDGGGVKAGADESRARVTLAWGKRET
jgi:hypothetical protein